MRTPIIDITDILIVLCFIALGGISLYFFITGIKNIISDIFLLSDKVQTIGKVLSIEENSHTDSDGSSSSSSYAVLVQINAHQKNYTGYIHLSSRDSIYFTLGSDIGIIYQRLNPNNMRFDGGKLFFSGIIRIVLGIVIVMAILAYMSAFSSLA